LIYVGFELINEFDGILKVETYGLVFLYKTKPRKSYKTWKKKRSLFLEFNWYSYKCMFLLLIDAKQNLIHVYFKAYTI
jgi:hypothetical protein